MAEPGGGLAVALLQDGLAVSTAYSRSLLEPRILHMHALLDLVKAEAVAAANQDESLVCG